MDLDMDKIFYNGCISTLDDDDSFVEAVGIADGKIAFTGSTKDALSLPCSDQTDLQGKLMLPGFVDSHLHMLHYAFVEKSVKLFDCKSVEDTLAAASAKLTQDKDKGLRWLFCRGWNEELFSNRRYPTRQELDEVTANIPLIMVRVCGHIAVCNTCGLQKLQAIEEFSEIQRDVDLDSGLIKENAVQFFYSVLDTPSQSQIEEYIKVGMRRLNEKGITAIHSDDLASLPGKDWRRILNAFQSLELRREMSVRIYEQCLFERFFDLKAFISMGYRTGQGGDFFRIGPIKLLQDGSLGARTAALKEPYEGDYDNLGLIIYEQNELNQIIAFCDENHMQVAVHCIGDRAMDMVISAIESSPFAKINPKNRHGIVHAQITNQKILDKMKAGSILAYIQPVFVSLDMNIVEPRIGPSRMDKVYAWKSMLDMGIRASGGSDAPVVSFDVMENIYFAVTRKNTDGEPEKGWLPEECLSVPKALRLFTKYPAYASFSENTNGTIEVGKLADLVVLEKNIFTVPPQHIKDIQIAMTVVNGNIVYEK